MGLGVVQTEMPIQMRDQLRGTDGLRGLPLGVPRIIIAAGFFESSVRDHDVKAPLKPVIEPIHRAGQMKRVTGRQG